jgi:hypothetical protein
MMKPREDEAKTREDEEDREMTNDLTRRIARAVEPKPEKVNARMKR